jgi:hypothetical protein
MFIRFIRDLCCLEFLESWRSAALTDVCKALKSVRIDRDSLNVCNGNQLVCQGRVKSASLRQATFAVCVATTLPRDQGSFRLCDGHNSVHAEVNNARLSSLGFDAQWKTSFGVNGEGGRFLYHQLDKQRLYLHSIWIDTYTHITFIEGYINRWKALKVKYRPTFWMLYCRTQMRVSSGIIIGKVLGEYTTIRLFISVGE